MLMTLVVIASACGSTPTPIAAPPTSAPTPTPTAAPPTSVDREGLVAYFPFDGDANDASGNGHHGTVDGATLTTDRNGEDGRAYAFDGVDDFISVMDSPDFDIGGGDMTVLAWVFHQAGPRFKGSETRRIYGIRSNRSSGTLHGRIQGMWTVTVRAVRLSGRPFLALRQAPSGVPVIRGFCRGRP